MKIPSINLSALPDLDKVTGMFGSLSDLASAYTDDRIVMLMVYMYELIPPEDII